MSKPSSKSKDKEKEAATTTKSKEIRIITRQVVTIDDVKKDPGKVKLIYIMSIFGEISDKALHYLIYEMKNKGYDLGYSFTQVGNMPYSKELSNDLVALRYTGLVETSASRKNIVSSLGREFLDKNISVINEQERDLVKKLIDELRMKIKPIDLEVELRFKTSRARRRLFF